MIINEDQYETLQTIFPDCAIDAFSEHGKLTIVVWEPVNEEEE